MDDPAGTTAGVEGTRPQQAQIRPARAGDLESMVLVHLRSFPGFFLSLAGPGFIREYYRSVLECPDGISLVAAEQNGLAGFAAGFLDAKAFYRFYRSRRIRLAVQLLAGLARRPWLLARVLRNARRVTSVESSPHEAELSSIGVDPLRAGHGLGGDLVRAFLAEAARRGATSVSLTTDRLGNDAVNLFYRNLGFELAGTRRQGRRELNLYRIRLPYLDSPHKEIIRTPRD